MYQSEAMWIAFAGHSPCAVKIDAISGKTWKNGLTEDPQNYVVSPDQPWLDDFNVSEDHIRQFVAMPLGEGFSAEEQITGKAEHGEFQLIVYPMKAEKYSELLKHPSQQYPVEMESLDIMYCLTAESPAPDMGLAPSGLMRQTIQEDDYGIDAWDQQHGLRCFIHLANSE